MWQINFMIIWRKTYRDDRVVNICEIKFYSGVFSITKQYDLELRKKISAFTEQSKKKKKSAPDYYHYFWTQTKYV